MAEVILTKTGAACLKIVYIFFNNIIVLALKRLKKCRFFQKFQSFFSYRQIMLLINFHGAKYQTVWSSLIFFFIIVLN